MHPMLIRNTHTVRSVLLAVGLFPFYLLDKLMTRATRGRNVRL